MVSARNEKNDARILESLGMSVERINESNQKGEEAKEVQKQLNKLRAENKSKIEPLEKEEKQASKEKRREKGRFGEGKRKRFPISYEQGFDY